MSIASDPSEDDTYRAVGLALSRWEMIEVDMADLYSNFMKRPTHLGLLMKFGHERHTFARRLEAVEKAAARFFARHPHQEFEGRFHNLVDHVQAIAVFRNQIAHGLVQLENFDNRDGSYFQRFVLLSPTYATVSLKAPEGGLDASEIDALSNQFVDAHKAIMAYSNEITAFLPSQDRRP